jgi:hypothetical protein
MKARFLYVAIVVLAAIAVPSVAQERNVNFDPLLEQVRADLKADKVAIVTEALKLTPAEADKFWPVYRKYQAEVEALNDDRIKLVLEYADKFDTMTDAQAKNLADKYFGWEMRRMELRKAYFDKFSKATSAMTATKFVQVDHRIDMLVDLQVAAGVPALFIKGTAAGK